MKTTVHVFTGEGVDPTQAADMAEIQVNDWLREDQTHYVSPLPEYTVTTNCNRQIEDGADLFSFTITIVRKGM
jgi:hypothetical protein